MKRYTLIAIQYFVGDNQGKLSGIDKQNWNNFMIDYYTKRKGHILWRYEFSITDVLGAFQLKNLLFCNPI